MIKIRTFKKLLSSLIAFQIAVAPIASSFANTNTNNGGDSNVESSPARSGLEATVNDLVSEGLTSPDLQNVQRRLEDVATQLEQSDEQTAPQNTPNLFFMGFQELVYKGERYDLSRKNLSLPTIPFDPRKFDSEIKTEINREERTLSFVYMNGNEVIAKHVINKIDVVSFARHATEMQILTSDGRMHAVNMGFARSQHVLFKNPIPLLFAGRLADEFLPIAETVKLNYLTRGMRPPTQVHAAAAIPLDYEDKFVTTTDADGTARKIFSDKAALEARPLILTTRDGQELIGIHQPEVTQAYMNLGVATLANLAYVISPQGQSEEFMGMMGDGQVAQAVSQAESRLNGPLREALSTFSPRLLTLLLGRVAAVESQLRDPRDRFTYAGWRSDFEKMASRAQAEQSDMEQSWKTLLQQAQNEDSGLAADSSTQTSKPKKSAYSRMLEKLVSSGVLKILGTLVAFDAAAVGLHEYGGLLVDGTGPDWAVHLAASLYEVMPDVLKDSAYRVTMFKGMHFLGSFILVNFIVGSIVGKLNGWDFKKALATIGVRIAAQLQFSFLGRLTQLTRQSTFIRALQNGMSPFAKIRANSTVGRLAGIQNDLRPGLVNPFSAGQARRTDTETRNRVIEAKNTVEERKRALAFLIANLVTAEQFGVDPMLLLMLRKGLITDSDMAKKAAELNQIMANPAFRAATKKVARELAVLLDNSELLEKDVAQLDAKLILKEVEAAKVVANKIKTRSALADAFQNLKLRLSDFMSGQGLRAVGHFGQEQYEFLKTVDVSPFVKEQAWVQFWIDFTATVVQVPFLGDRSNMNVPEELAHSENHLGWTTPGHMADMGNQYAIYGISLPARLSQVYGDSYLNTREERFDPIEFMTQQTVAKRESFVKSVWSWMRSASSLREANYGHYVIKDFLKRLKSIQLVFVMDFLSRVVIAGQNVSAAFPAFFCMLIGAQAGYAWPWTPISRGLQISGEHRESRNTQLRNAQTFISQGLRIGDQDSVARGQKMLLELYEEYSDLGERANAILKDAEKLLALPAQDWATTEAMLSRSLTPILKLHLALESKDKQKIEEAHKELIAIYNSTSDIEAKKEVQALDAQTLMEYSLKYPPFDLTEHPGVSTLLNLIGSVVTTYLGTNMFVDLLRRHSWNEKIMEWGMIAALFYGGLYMGQKAINNMAATIDYIRLREKLPVEAFALAQSGAPNFVSLNEYVDWLQKRPNAPDLLKNTPRETVVGYLQDFAMREYGGEKKFITHLNAAATPAAQAIVSCAATLTGNQTVAPMSKTEKLKALWRGLFRPPVK